MSHRLHRTGRAKVRFSGRSCFCALLLLGLSVSFAARATAKEPPVIFLVRHAERAAISGRVPSDTGLSPEGRARAQSLAKALRDVGIAAIYTSEYQRTRETAVPLAESLGIRPQVIPADGLRPLVAKIRAGGKNALVVGHSNTLPQILNALGVTARVTVSESDYDNLFLVILEEPPRLLRLHYR